MLVETHSLTKTYRHTTALSGCDLSVPRGEILGLLGPNGAGKTTLLRLLMGYLRPSAGSATIDGFDCYRQSVEVHRRVAYLPGDVRLFPTMRGRDVLRFFCDVRASRSVRRVTATSARSAGGAAASLSHALAVADRLALDITRPVATMSTGMRQKLAIAAVLAADTPLVVLDEPTSNLDPSVRREVVEIVRELQRNGRTIIFSSHILDEVEEACDRVYILRQGRVAHEQVMSELKRQHRISARLTAALPPLPAELHNDVRVRYDAADAVTIETPGELSPLLGWLATLPVSEVRIEPFRLRSIYDQYHAAEET